MFPQNIIHIWSMHLVIIINHIQFNIPKTWTIIQSCLMACYLTLLAKPLLLFSLFKFFNLCNSFFPIKSVFILSEFEDYNDLNPPMLPYVQRCQAGDHYSIFHLGHCLPLICQCILRLSDRWRHACNFALYNNLWHPWTAIRECDKNGFRK